MKRPQDLTTAEREELRNLFTYACAVGASLGLDPTALAGCLLGYGGFLLQFKNRPLQSFVDHPPTPTEALPEVEILKEEHVDDPKRGPAN